MPEPIDKPDDGMLVELLEGERPDVYEEMIHLWRVRNGHEFDIVRNRRDPEKWLLPPGIEGPDDHPPSRSRPRTLRKG